MERPYFHDREFVQRDYTVQPLAPGEYDGCVFRQCRFPQAYMDNRSFMECRFEACDLSHANVAHTTFKEVIFKDCKMLGLDFHTCDPLLFSASFENCTLDYSSFFGMGLKGTSFRDCRLLQVDFSHCDLGRADFSGSDLQGAIFQHTDLSGTDLRGGLNFDIDPSQNKMAKCRFQRESLAGLLKKYDLVID